MERERIANRERRAKTEIVQPHEPRAAKQRLVEDLIGKDRGLDDFCLGRAVDEQRAEKEQPEAKSSDDLDARQLEAIAARQPVPHSPPRPPRQYGTRERHGTGPKGAQSR